MHHDTQPTLCIEVTPEHIRCGQRNRHRACALALAFEHAGFASADVGVTSALLRDDRGVAYLIGLPDEAQRFVADFDAGRPVAPFRFSVPL